MKKFYVMHQWALGHCIEKIRLRWHELHAHNAELSYVINPVKFKSSAVARRGME